MRNYLVILAILVLLFEIYRLLPWILASPTLGKEKISETAAKATCSATEK